MRYLNMKNIIGLFLLLILFTACAKKESKLLLIFNPENEKASALANQINAIGNAIEVDTTSSLSNLHEDTLKNYPYLLLAGIKGDALAMKHQNHLERYIQASGELMLVGSNLTPKYRWEWHKSLLTELDKQKTEPEIIKNVSLQTENNKQVALNFDGGKISIFPLANLSLESLTDQIKPTLLPNYKKAKSLRAPDEDRFVRVVLDDDLNEPMELTVLPNGKVIYTEREGKVKLYNPDTKEVKELTTFEVSTEGNYEDGLLGVEADPNFNQNGWIYFYYSLPGDLHVQRLSRFFMSGDSILRDTERKILDVPVQRETCCHSGGSIQFGPDGNLYLSTGDNTSSKESNGYSPLDERPGRAPFDAQKSSGNANDLRGAILRIKVNKDGSYSIPDGNLFPKDGSKGKPEIYVMGARNPFRISVDPKTGYLYWGDVGPDSGVDSEQGPQSYDEFNRAKAPGNYGWPYFVGDNKAYPDFDFTTNTPGEYFDPKKPVNNSPYNTGAKILPPAQTPLMWYPYSVSEIWPELGKGSRSAMAGPVYYSDMYQNSEVKFPSYYDGKLFIYEWARSWIMTVSFDEHEGISQIEPFLTDMPLSKPIDLEFGPNGAMYLLEYGANYFANNDEARLVKIEYAEGNRAPEAIIKTDTKAGAAPLIVNFSGEDSYDFDKEDNLTYQWQIGDTEIEGSEVAHTFETPGEYKVKLIVQDDYGKKSEAISTIKVGNAPPEIEIVLSGNSSFYFDNEQIQYKINVIDKEDGKIPAEKLKAGFEYLGDSKDLALLSSNSLQVLPYLKGKNLIAGSDCASCHDIEENSIGPSYKQIAIRYETDKETVDMLAGKIITGGNGNWGHSMMAAHPQHTAEETKKMVDYILSLDPKEQLAGKIMPLDGELVLKKHLEKEENGAYIFSVAYTDEGANGMPALSANKMLILESPRVEAEDYEDFQNVARQRPRGGNLSFVGGIKDGSYFELPAKDLSDIGSLTYRLANSQVGGTVSLHLDSPTGKQISTLTINEEGNWRTFKEFTTILDNAKGVHDLYFVFKHPTEKNRSFFSIDWVQFNRKEVQ